MPEKAKPLDDDILDSLLEGMISGEIEIPRKPQLFLVCHTCGGNFFSERRNRCSHLVVRDGQRLCSVHSDGQSGYEPCVAPRKPIYEPIYYTEPDDLDAEGRPKEKYHFEPSKTKFFYDYFYCLKCASEGLWPREQAYHPRPLSPEVQGAALFLEGAPDMDHVPVDLEPVIHDFLRRHEGHEVGPERW